MVVKMWKPTELDHAIAEEFFGWKWMSSLGKPTKGHPDYYGDNIRVRRFHPPESLTSKDWKAYWAKHDGREADGTEPLDYCYCSSAGQASVPHYSGDHSAVSALEKELRKRKFWSNYRMQLWAQVIQADTDGKDIDEERLADADCRTRCIAALAVVESKFVKDGK